MRSIALLSSGLDSAVAFKMTYDITGVELAITFDYGQRAAKKEAECAKAICDRFHVRHELIKLPWLKAITATALVNKKAAVPTPTAADLDDIKGKALETAHLVWVPNREWRVHQRRCRRLRRCAQHRPDRLRLQRGGRRHVPGQYAGIRRGDQQEPQVFHGESCQGDRPRHCSQ